MLSSEPGTIATALADRLQQRGVVGGAAPMSARCAASSTGKRNACGRLGAVQALARHGGGDQAVGHALQRIGDRHGGDRAGGVLQRRQQGRDGPGRDQRPRRVVHQHDVGRRGLQRLQPGPHAVLAGGAARHRRQVRQTARAPPRSPPASPTGCSRSTWAASASAAWRITGLPASDRNCFGVSAPNRLPEPAATRIAAIRMPAPLPASRSASTAAGRARMSGSATRAMAGLRSHALASGFALHIGRRVANLPNMMGKCHSDTTVSTCELPPIDLGGGVRIDTPVILAPMSGVTDLPFRRLAKQLGAGMVVSEMIASWAMIRENRKTLAMAEMDGVGGISALQLAGCEPAAMAEAARLAVDRGADLIDINFGCPVKKVALGQQAGSALMRDEAAAAAILAATVRAVRRAGDAEDAHGLGPCQPERAAAGAHRPGLRHPHGHRAWPHPPAVLHRLGRLGLHRPGEGRGGHPGHRQRRHRDRGGCRRGAAPLRRGRR